MAKTKSCKALPKTEPLPGAVCEQFRRCGKPNCHCSSGELHGPYFFRFWRQGGKLRKQYIKRADVEAVRQACGLHRQRQANLRTELKRSREEYREALRFLRRVWR